MKPLINGTGAQFCLFLEEDPLAFFIACTSIMHIPLLISLVHALHLSSVQHKAWLVFFQDSKGHQNKSAYFLNIFQCQMQLRQYYGPSDAVCYTMMETILVLYPLLGGFDYK